METKTCINCGEEFIPKDKRNIKFCSRKCANIYNNKKKEYQDSFVFIENSTVSRHNVKRRIIERNLIEYKCGICGSAPIWNEKSLPLILDHINGINNDHRLENMRFICSNCDSQLPTYKYRRGKNGR